MRKEHRSEFTPASYRRAALALGAVTASSSAALGAVVQISLTGNFIQADASTGNRGTIDNHLNFDFGGDGLPDGPFAIDGFARARAATYPNSYRYPDVRVGLTIPVNRLHNIRIFADADAGGGLYGGTGYHLKARAAAWRSYSSRPYFYTASTESRPDFGYSHVGAEAADFIPITISDTFINGGDPVQAWLHYSAGANGSRFGMAAALRLVRVVFDNENFGLRPAEYDHGGERFGMGPSDGPFPEFGAEPGPLPVPEPSGIALLALGAGGLLARRQRRDAPPQESPAR